MDECGSTWCCDGQSECARPISQELTSEPVCRALPPHYRVGDITITGLTAGPTTITLAPGEHDRYYPTQEVMGRLFAADDTIVAQAAGGTLAAFSLESPAVAPLELASLLDLKGDRTITWTPADSGSRVQLSVNVGSHDPNPLIRQILCDAPDDAGKFVIPASMAQASVAGWSDVDSGFLLKCSRLTRYRRTLHPDADVELFVGSARNVLVTWPAL